MPKNAKSALADLDKLTALRDQPEALQAHALKLIRARQNTMAVASALRALIEASLITPELRPLLLETYAYYAADGVKRDPTDAARCAVLEALHEVIRQEDIPLLERALTTYERIPPFFAEEAGLLRAAALVVLTRLDPLLATYHAARLLSEPIEVLAGEPHLTAIRVLAGQNQRVPIYAYVMQPTLNKPEPLGEALRQLIELPTALMDGVLRRHGESASDIVLAGMFDLLIGHEAWERYLPVLTDYLQKPISLPAYRYLITALIASRRIEYLTALIAAAHTERDALRKAALAETLALLESDPQVKSVLVALRR